LNRYSGGHVRAMILFSILSNLMVLAPSFHMLQVYDRVLSSGSMATLFYITVIVLFALAVYGFAETMRLRIAQRLAAKYTVINTEKLFAKLAREVPASDAGRYLRDFATIRAYLANRAFAGLFDIPFIPLFLLLLFIVHWSIGLVTLFGIVAMAVVAALNVRATEAERAASVKAEADATTFAQLAFQRGEDVRAMGLLPAFITEWSNKCSAALKAGEAASGKASAYYSLGKAVRQGLQVLIMAWGAFLVLSGNMSGGLIFLSSMISGKALGPIEMLIGGWDGLSKARTAFVEIEDLLGEDRTLRTRPSLPPARGRLSCENLSYTLAGCETNQTLIEGVTFSVEPGELVVVTGPAASGKTVLARILAGALQPTDGLLRLDGAAHDQWPTAQWGQAIGYLAQEPEFFPGTVAWNIARFGAGFQPKDVYEAAMKAGAHEHILRLPQGYQTVIGTGAVSLPSSLNQAIALARAFYGNPKCLVLDQPSAHLDPTGEESLVRTLEAAKARGTAIVVITRRSAVFKLASRVLLMREGRIVPAGPQSFSAAAPKGADGERPGPPRSRPAPRSLAG
jgi:PrtD family type I secretion system ABC transporter